MVPEEWTGEVDGHSFYFCERRGEWRIELDLRPSGRFVRTLTEDDSDGAGQCYERELDEGDVIASGTIDVEGYGSTPAQRADFIIDTIRVHLARQACTLHRDNLPSIQASLGGVLSWCPACGTRLSTS